MCVTEGAGGTLVCDEGGNVDNGNGANQRMCALLATECAAKSLRLHVYLPVSPLEVARMDAKSDK